MARQTYSKMTYVTVKEESDEKLHLSREPSARAWAIAVGRLSLCKFDTSFYIGYGPITYFEDGLRTVLYI